MKKKFKLIFFIAILAWICYIIKTRVLDLIVGNYLMGRKIEKYENKLKTLSENSEKEKKDIPINLFTLASMTHDKLHDYEKALAYFQEILVKFPECDFSELVQYMVADCYEKMGRIELAIHEYRKYIENYPAGKQAESAQEKLKSFESASQPQSAKS